MRFLKIFIIGVWLISGAVIMAQTDGASLDERGYGLYVPTSYQEDGDDALPLLIVLHGFGDTWDRFYPATGMIARAEADNFIVAFPQGYLDQWNDGSVGDHEEDDIQLFRDLIERVERDYRVDRDRIYLAGFSNGGTMVYKAACEAPDLFAGVAAVGGTMRTAQSDNCDDAQLPVMMIHGTSDRVVDFDGGEYRYSVPRAAIFWAEQNDCNLEGVPLYTEMLFRDGYTSYVYEECPDGNYVFMHVLRNVDHIWPGGGAYLRGLEPQPPHTHTARLIWGFFELTYQASLEEDAASSSSTPETDD